MHTRGSVLVLDDDPQFSAALAQALAPEFQLHAATSFAEAVPLLEQHPIECLILDYDLGTEDGLDGLDRIREIRKELPVIVVSGKLSLKMAVGFLNRQISGFFEKPPELSQLREKLRVAMRERKAVASILGIEVDVPRRAVRRDGAEVLLTPIEYKILWLFLQKPGERVTRDEITQQVWGEVQLSRNTLDTHLGNLRRKVPSFGERLRAVYGEGFCLEV